MMKVPPIDRAAFGELLRTFVALTADFNRSATDPALKAKAYDLHKSAALLAGQLGLKGGALSPDLLVNERTGELEVIKELRAEVRRLEGGGLPARIADERTRRKEAESAARQAKTDLRRAMLVVERATTKLLELDRGYRRTVRGNGSR